MSVHLEREITRLKKFILEMCARSEQAVQDAAAALAGRDDALASRVIAGDGRIDQFEINVEEDCLKVLALHQPVASDLRFIVAVMRLNRDLERIGDLAVKIAERAQALNREPPGEPIVDFAPLARQSLSMLHRSIDSLINLDGALAREVIAADDITAEIFPEVDVDTVDEGEDVRVTLPGMDALPVGRGGEPS